MELEALERKGKKSSTAHETEERCELQGPECVHSSVTWKREDEKFTWLNHRGTYE